MSSMWKATECSFSDEQVFVAGLGTTRNIRPLKGVLVHMLACCNTARKLRELDMLSKSLGHGCLVSSYSTKFEEEVSRKDL